MERGYGTRQSSTLCSPSKPSSPSELTTLRQCTHTTESNTRMTHSEQVKEYIATRYPDYDIDDCSSKGDNVEICENGDVHYNSFTIIKTHIQH